MLQRTLPAGCLPCADTGAVCENHPDRPWGGVCCTDGGRGLCGHGSCGCGPGKACPACGPLVPDYVHTPPTPPGAGAPFPALGGNAFTPDMPAGDSHA